MQYRCGVNLQRRRSFEVRDRSPQVPVREGLGLGVQGLGV